MEREKLIDQLMAGKSATFAADNGEAGFIKEDTCQAELFLLGSIARCPLLGLYHLTRLLISNLLAIMP